MQQSWRHATLLKETPTRVLSREYSQSFRNIFFIEQLRWLVLSYVLVSERIFKKRKIQLACSMYKYKSLLEVQLAREHLSSLQNFIITKYLKQEVNDDLSVRVDERSSCGLSLTGYIKIYQCHVIKSYWRYYPQWIRALSTSVTELLLLPKFNKSSSSVTGHKEICQVIMS